MSNCVFTRSGIEMEAGLKPGQLDSTVVESVVNMKLAASRDVVTGMTLGQKVAMAKIMHK